MKAQFAAITGVKRKKNKIKTKFGNKQISRARGRSYM
jgi:hypothetical protein